MQKDYRRYAAVILVLAIIIPGSIFELSHAPAPASTTSTTSQQQGGGLGTWQLSDKSLTLNQFLQQIEVDYLGGSAFGVLNVCTYIQASNDNLTGIVTPYSSSVLRIENGNVKVCPSIQGGITFSFSGTAISGGLVLTSLVFSYEPTVQTATTQGGILPSSLSPAFSTLPSSIQGQVLKALDSSTQPGQQISYLSGELQNQTSVLGAIPGLAGKDVDYAAAFLLNLSTEGTALANSAYSSLLGASTTETSTT